jgi:N-acetyl-anhydromuramyl-L-alanine amidase AmpD
MHHYRVSADGRIWLTQPESLVVWHASAANYNGLAICCDLGFDQEPPEEQLRGLRALLDWLCHERSDITAGRPDVWGHRDLRTGANRTRCPGTLLTWVQAYRQGS